MATLPSDPGSPGQQRARQVIAEQDARHQGDSDAKLYMLARDLFDEAASLLHDGLQGSARAAINDAYRKSGDARVALEVLARRWMKDGNR